MRAHAREQLGEAERLDQVVVGAGVEAGDDVELLVARGEDQDREVGPRGAQPPADVDAVDVGQPEVEDDEADALVGGGERRAPARDAAHRVALAVEHAREARGDRLVVLDDAGCRRRSCDRSVRARTAGSREV